MSHKIRFEVQLPPVGLRRNRQTPKHGYRAALVRQYQEACWLAGYEHAPRKPWEKARVTLTWCAASVLPDTDNALSSCKWLIDVLKATGPRPLGIVVDDSPDCLTITMKVAKCGKRLEERVEVLIERVMA